MTRTLHAAAATVALALTLMASACTPGEDPGRSERQVLVVSPPDPDAPRHTHQTMIGDGTTSQAGGYRMASLTFPASTDGPGRLTFQIVGPDGEPVLDYVEEQTKLLHLYVVRDDLSIFRHVHPELGADGTWAAYVDLDEPGRYRVVAEFVPSDRPGGSHIVLAGRAGIDSPQEGSQSGPEAGPESGPEAGPEAGDAGSSTASDGIVTVTGPDALATGNDEEMVLTVSDGNGGVLNLGTYLGAYAHLTGFEETTGAFVHAHPLGAPTSSEQGSELRFHTSFDAPGVYRFFVQVRVDGYVHTVPLTLRVR